MRNCKKVPCTIGGQPIKNNRKGGVATKSVSRLQTAGDSGFTSSNKPLDYPSLEAAVIYINNEINGGETDPEDIADDLMCLGDLLISKKEPAKAFNAYTRAAEYYEAEYGDDDLSAIEARLSSAQACKEAKNDAQGLEIVSKNINILEKILASDMSDLEFAKQHNDENAIDFLCNEIIEIYDFLGWAYEIKGNAARSEDYYNKKDTVCQ